MGRPLACSPSERKKDRLPEDSPYTTTVAYTAEAFSLPKPGAQKARRPLILNFQPQTLNPKPQGPNPKLATPNPKPQTPRP